MILNKCSILRIPLFLVLLVCLLPGILSAGNNVEKRITIITSDHLKSSARATYGVKKTLSSLKLQIKIDSIIISGNESEYPSGIAKIKENRPDVLVTVGSSATRFAKENFPDLPIVFVAVKYPVLSGFVTSHEQPGGNITGASLDIPEDVQFRYFRKLIPGLKRIGVIYTSNTESLIPQATIIARQMGMKMIPVLISSPKELAVAIDSLSKTVDGIWSVADMDLFNAKSTKFLISNTLRKRIPFMGFSRNIVESGALFSLDFDYKAVGFQAGEIVGRVLNGEKPSEIKVTTSDLIWFHYNEKTARHIGVKVPEELIAVAKEVYR